MAGKKHRSRHANKPYTSKGIHTSSIKTASMHTSAQRMLYKQDALAKGRDVYYTIANPNKNETNKPFIRIKVDGKLWLARQKYAHKMTQEADA